MQLHRQLKHHILSLQQVNDQQEKAIVPRVNEEIVGKYIKSLKAGKAADVEGLTAEHVKFAAPCLNLILTSMFNAIFEDRTLPSQFRTGVITPILKKGKPSKKPDSYRRITVSSILGKVLEKHLLAVSKEVLKDGQDPLQFGFTEKCSPSLCALLITEASAEAKDARTPLYLTFLDSSKAFDLVDHDVMLNALHDQGITGNTWHLYNNMYSEITARVKCDGELSCAITE